MASKVKPIPDGWHSLTPHLITKNGAETIKFYEKAFGAQVLGKHFTPDGKRIMNATLKIGNSPFMIADEMPGETGRGAPSTFKGVTSSVYLMVEDVDAMFKQAVAAGAVPAMEPADMFWGDRWGMVIDPEGHAWQLATHYKDITPEEMEAGAKEFMASMQK